MSDRFEWLRVVGGGCFINLAVTGLLVGAFAAFVSFSLDSIVLPFLIGAAASFGASLYLLRQSEDSLPVMRKAILASLGVALGSLLAVLGIAGLLVLGA